ncbi:hypothetical protein CRG98_007374 [Punica granatum]|uniref:Reverse transcriptase Ty1/copia-type domain-containing protein n=1 Tax=Punica granatum TaxID=22663 RepID=A0A2I0KUU3_PUNGR|nr:hypothetical protein CRG98_007374 [Punica granatum]
MATCKPIRTPMEERLKLTREGSGVDVNPTYLKRLVGSLKYLTSTRPDLVYSVGELVGFTDSDWRGDVGEKKSTSGYAFSLGNRAFSWSSKKQQVVALSTAEAEYIAAAY